MTPIPMKMARASQEDIEAVLTLNMILGELDNCNHPMRTASFPVGPDGEFVEGDPDYFDEDDPEHCKIVLNRILKVLNLSPGCTNRVIWGFHTIMSENNKVVDLTSDTLAFHPDLVAAKEKAAHYDTVRTALEVITHVVGHNDCSDGRTPNGFAVALDRARTALQNTPHCNPG
jgi:hypothetical protein